MTKPFTCSIKRIRFDENYEPANNTRLTTNFANLARGESRQENLTRTLAMIIGHQDTGDIRPVFVNVRVQSRRRKRTGDVAAAAGEGFDVAVGHHAVENSWANDHPAPVAERRSAA